MLGKLDITKLQIEKLQKEVESDFAIAKLYEEKKEQVINAITDQGKMTEDLKKKILSAETLVAVDDLYRPYRPKKQTRTLFMFARANGTN